MTRRLLLGYLSITLFVLLVLEIPLGVSFARRERDRLAEGLAADAATMASLVEDGLDQGVPTDYVGIARRYADQTGARAVIVDLKGISVADTEEPIGRDFSTRPEVADALAGRRIRGTRASQTLGHSLFYVATPVASGGRVHGAIRLTFPTSSVDERVRRNWYRLGLLAAVVLGAAGVAGIALARSVTRPLRRLEGASMAMAGGDLSARAGSDSGPPDLRRLSRTFDTMAGRIERLVLSQQAFVADASHQLRTPLTALRLRLENIEARLPDVGSADIDAAVGEVLRLSELVDQLLLLARAEQGTLPSEVVDLTVVARERGAVWGAVCEEQGVSLEVQTDGPVDAISVRGAVEQIVDNLLDNALAVSGPGDRLVVSTLRARDHAELHVLDQGPGMSDEDRVRAFERFWTRHTEGSSGTGLGLPIARELALAVGGDVQLREAPGGGIDATVVLPPGHDGRR